MLFSLLLAQLALRRLGERNGRIRLPKPIRRLASRAVPGTRESRARVPP